MPKTSVVHQRTLCSSIGCLSDSQQPWFNRLTGTSTSRDPQVVHLSHFMAPAEGPPAKGKGKGKGKKAAAEPAQARKSLRERKRSRAAMEADLKLGVGS